MLAGRKRAQTALSQLYGAVSRTHRAAFPSSLRSHSRWNIKSRIAAPSASLVDTHTIRVSDCGWGTEQKSKKDFLGELRGEEKDTCGKMGRVFLYNALADNVFLAHVFLACSRSLSIAAYMRRHRLLGKWSRLIFQTLEKELPRSKFSNGLSSQEPRSNNSTSFWKFRVTR